MPKTPRRAASISFEHFTEVTTAALLRALELRRGPFGPILIGIIYYPGGLGAPGRGAQVLGPGAARPAQKR